MHLPIVPTGAKDVIPSAFSRHRLLYMLYIPGSQHLPWT